MFPNARSLRASRACASAALLAGVLAACALPAPAPVVSRPDGEGYAGVGERVVLIRVVEASATGALGLKHQQKERASVELRYLGLDSAGRAVFQRHDVDQLAGTPLARAPASDAGSGETAKAPESTGPIDTQRIVLDMRMARQIRVQGKIVEVLEASSSGVVYRLY